MYPFAFNLSRVRIVLVGSQELATRRLAQLKEAGATQVITYIDQLPEAHEIRQAQLLMVAGLDNETSVVLASIAKLQGVLVNVEDKNDLCDFYFTSFVKRGDLTISVSTGGASPTLGQEIRAYIARIFDEKWGAIVRNIGQQRLQWKCEGLDNKAVGERTRALIKDQKLLSLSHEEAA